ncbi:MAG TPA: beta-1,3-glucanase family protein [Thermoanaerobaculia bacterium]|nr:beta-1,3-glucanase family protein [Thermoanaerobaculia bacterium]
MTTPSTVPLTITNDSGQPDSSVYLAIIGLDANNLWAFVNADGSTTEFSLTNASDAVLSLTSLTNNQLTLPQLVSGQIYFSVGSTLTIATVSDPKQPGGVGLQLPAGWDTGNPNYDVMYDVIEFTFDGAGLNCDLTQVDAFGLPISMQVTGSQNGTQSAGGWNQSRSQIFATFLADSTYAPLVLTDGATQLRIVNPSHGIDLGLFSSTFFDTVIQNAWNQYTSASPLEINIAGGSYAGNYLGTTSGANTPMIITLGGTTVGQIDYPTTSQVFYCNGVFDQGNTAMGAVANVVATAINRGILATSPQPDCTVGDFYPANGTWNGYAQLLHTLANDGLCYAFAYDDQCNQSSDLSESGPTGWSITIASLS